LEDLVKLSEKIGVANETNRALLKENNSLLKLALKAEPSRAAKHATSARWARLEKARQLAFKRRAEYAHLKRSPAIDNFLPEILEACRAAGEPLSGGDPKATVERWFRKAGIK